MENEQNNKQINDYSINKSKIDGYNSYIKNSFPFGLPSTNEVNKNILKDKENSIPYLPSNNSDTSNIKLSEIQKKANKFNQNIKNCDVNNNFNLELDKDIKNIKIQDLPKNDDKNKKEECIKDLAYENINEKGNNLKENNFNQNDGSGL